MAAGAWLNAITREYSPSENAFSSLVWNIPFTWKPDDGIELALALANSLIKEKMFKPEAVYYAYLTWMLSRPFKGKQADSYRNRRKDQHVAQDSRVSLFWEELRVNASNTLVCP